MVETRIQWLAAMPHWSTEERGMWPEGALVNLPRSWPAWWRENVVKAVSLLVRDMTETRDIKSLKTAIKTQF